MKSFNNQVAAITGAGSGIGRALALNLAHQGCHLALSDVNTEGLAQTVELAKANSIRITQHKVDVAQRQEVLDWASQVIAEHGRINLLINNAGVAQGGTTEGNDYSDYEWIMSINFWGVVNGTKAFLPHIKASGSGHIVNISSIFGIFAQPGMGAYNASKFAVRGFTEALRQELDIAGYGISASCVHPGGIKTNIANSARMNASMDSLTGTNAASAKSQFNDQLLKTTPEKAAQVILDGVLKNKRRILIGTDARMADLMQRLLPAGYQRLVTAAMRMAAKGNR
ncbi:SDR family NAD(P)-dependent oxidoreductase [Pseudomonas sp. TTU2014-080ASC]|uniref:SDR family NAD(P)-dependent oxidoreductase n=1 Tax=Pseudomonas sp. TTU2014-080ASC TaxID=1729724 RepID=UPI00071840D8|nr:SDR family NAD(P)-dependent oxidoreductase [Pseudomonas sp. TTU2014-080ASC]KRW59971.1 short-chain dehydrogenase [Pseudomonas sp. TTU2014-080ASC]